jgi:hypothetical protein
MLVSILVVLGYIGLLAFVLWFLAIRPRLPLKDKISVLLQLLAGYTFILGLLSASGVFTFFGSLQLELTSPDALLFLRANLLMFAGIFGAMTVALDPSTLSVHPWIAPPVLLVLTLLLFGYALIHFFVIVPLAYFAYLITSVPVDAILNAPSDVEIAIGTESVRIKALVLKNEAAIRNFAVGIPAFTVSFLLKIWPLVRRERSDR